MLRALIIINIILIIISSCSTADKKKTQEEDIKQPVDIHADLTEKDLMQADEKVLELAKCTLFNNSRVVSKIRIDKMGCRVDYTKNGKKLVMAQSEEDPAYCDESYSRILSTLKIAGFKCEISKGK